MKWINFLLAAALIPSPALAGDNITAQFKDLSRLFDSGADVMSASSIVAPFSEGRWGDAPRIEASPVKEHWTPYNDAFGQEACLFVDALNIRQPSVQESVAALEPCLQKISADYRVDIRATQGDEGLVLVVSGILPAGSTATSDLRHALTLREGRLFGHAASVVRLGRTSNVRKQSSLQFVVDRCMTIKIIHELNNSSDFLNVYGKCIRNAQGLSIQTVLAHPHEALGIVIYSKDPKNTIAEMNGIIEVPTINGALRIEVHALEEALSQSVLPATFHRTTY